MGIIKRLIRKMYQLMFFEFVERQIEEHLTVKPHIYGGDCSRARIDPSASIQNCLINVSSGEVVIEANVFCGHNVCLLTGTHEINLTGARRQGTWPSAGRDITIRKGAWLASNSTIIGPADIGENAVVAAGAVVRGNVPSGALFAGVPARFVKNIDLVGGS